MPLRSMRSILLNFAVVTVSVGLVAPCGAAGQTVRFETNASGFDVVLNPTDNPDLQPLVDNFLQYVESGRYVGVVINRAVENFVVQMATFRTDSSDVASLPSGGFPQLETFPPVIVDADNDTLIDFDTSSLSNTRGTVALALSVAGPNTGSASFFVNLVDNSFLDAQGFIPFAEIPDLTFMDQLANGPVEDLSSAVGQSGSLAYTDVPVVGGDQFVVLESVYVVPEPSTIAFMITAFGVTHARRRQR